MASPILCGSLVAAAQTYQQKPSATLPATQPTGSNSFAATSITPAVPLTPAQKPARHADVKYADGLLAITADNSSLNQILREIGRTTGIKITGGVAEERVFGKYGPSSAADVLQALLDGTGSNVLLVQPDTSAPLELILTPRHGGPTPPNPNAPGFDDDSPAPEDSPRQQPSQLPPAPNQPAANQPGAAQAPALQPAAQQAAPATTTPASTDATDPNAVKTPQQIYEQLQRLRQQQPPPQ